MFSTNTEHCFGSTDCASKDLLPNNEPANVSKTDNPVTSIASKCDENDADPNFEGELKLIAVSVNWF